jgi:hypothetical protein
MVCLWGDFGMMAMMKAAAQQQGGFSPLEVSWANAYWPGGPAFKAEGYPDGQVMNAGESIPDEAGSFDMTAVAQGTNTSLTLVNSSNVNSKPAIRATDTTGDHPIYSTGIMPTAVGYNGVNLDASATGWSLVVIWNQGAMTSNTYGCIVRDPWATSGFTLYAKNDGTLYIRIKSGNVFPSIGWSAGDTIAMLAKGTDDLRYVDIDGTNYYNDTGTGAYALRGVEAFMVSGAWPMSGDLAFIGVYEGDCTGDPAWSDFETWAADELGATV